MIPVHLDPAQTRIALVGRGPLTLRRLAWLRDAGGAPDVWSDAPSDELLVSAGAGLEMRLPQLADLANYHVVWIADLSHAEAKALADLARAARVLVNVEDVLSLCDFHTPAIVRRGKLTISAGTGGASPAVARAVRERLGAVFPETWTEALDDIARARTVLRAEGASSDAMVADARERLAARHLI